MLNLELSTRYELMLSRDKRTQISCYWGLTPFVRSEESLTHLQGNGCRADRSTALLEQKQCAILGEHLLSPHCCFGVRELS